MAKGPADRPSRMRGIPGLSPGFDAALKGGNELVCDAGVDVLAGFVCVSHGCSQDAETKGSSDELHRSPADRQGNGQHGFGAGRPLTGQRDWPGVAFELRTTGKETADKKSTGPLSEAFCQYSQSIPA